MTAIDLNADIGEFADMEGAQREKAVLAHVSSGNIACGGHAGDRETIRATLRAAHRMGVACGAHPSYPDRDGFGRQSIEISLPSLADSLAGQLALIARLAEADGIPLVHLKPHGALYHDAAAHSDIAECLCGLASRFGLCVFGPATPADTVSALAQAAREHKIRYVPEGFVDRRYQADGRLQPRPVEGAVLTDTDDQIAQAVSLATEGRVRANGAGLDLRVETLCLHGDSPCAGETAAQVAAALRAAGVTIRPPL